MVDDGPNEAAEFTRRLGVEHRDILLGIRPIPSDIPIKVLGSRQLGMQYTKRSSVRAVVTSSDGRVLIVKAHKENYYKLPGGGIEEGESHRETAEREVFEETGSRVSLQGSLFAMSEEFRHHLHQFSYCYRASLLEDTGKPELTEEEVDDGLCHEWVPLDKALEIMASVEPTSELGRYIKERDIFFLAEALKVADTQPHHCRPFFVTRSA
ncbi:hypothetical protein MFIFM68171_02056 [Madurella fahalii]|uniref:Nudix hydrolase domain-containing protein n=1 Tax=Madurella fahalii TaxID=1157608 RepID=A0ABQ0G284_9PEZI